MNNFTELAACQKELENIAIRIECGISNLFSLHDCLVLKQSGCNWSECADSLFFTVDSFHSLSQHLNELTERLSVEINAAESYTDEKGG